MKGRQRHYKCVRYTKQILIKLCGVIFLMHFHVYFKFKQSQNTFTSPYSRYIAVEASSKEFCIFFSFKIEKESKKETFEKVIEVESF
ncbi:CLUMA_CG017145, isoform A [Clunio marinus]|uniref:CLUMA_CG017145, isoform A n=1 Tax=Clunio marinus TaxID=568069 RepID=A0A1J1IUZ8_9DIPT|nr:CLUMA_CG017145, isoform A [Clunio marinus]